jgi:hypothetical protein
MRSLILIVISALTLGTARADPVRDALAEIAKCVAITDSSERLKCFDAAAALAKSALAVPAQPPEDKRSILERFGFPSPKPVLKAEDFGKPAPPPGPEEITQITATVTEFAKTARGRSIFILDNGQIWAQLEGDLTDVRAPPQGTPMKITIETGLFGSYNLTIDGRNVLIKVTRLK